jgi:hypothetical protein
LYYGDETNQNGDIMGYRYMGIFFVFFSKIPRNEVPQNFGTNSDAPDGILEGSPFSRSRMP